MWRSFVLARAGASCSTLPGCARGTWSRRFEPPCGFLAHVLGHAVFMRFLLFELFVAPLGRPVMVSLRFVFFVGGVHGRALGEPLGTNVGSSMGILREGIACIRVIRQAPIPRGSGCIRASRLLISYRANIWISVSEWQLR